MTKYQLFCTLLNAYHLTYALGGDISVVDEYLKEKYSNKIYFNRLMLANYKDTGCKIKTADLYHCFELLNITARKQMCGNDSAIMFDVHMPEFVPKIYFKKDGKTIPSLEVVIDGKLIGYIKLEENWYNRNIHTVYYDNGEPVKIACSTETGSCIHEVPLEAYYNGYKRFQLIYPKISFPRANLYPIWICNEYGEPKYIRDYEDSKLSYAENKWFAKYGFPCSFKLTEEFKEYEKEFDDKYSNCSMIKIEFKHERY